MGSHRSLVQSQMYPTPFFSSFQQSHTNDEFPIPFNPPPTESLLLPGYDAMIHEQFAHSTSFHTDLPQHTLLQPMLATGSTHPLPTGLVDGPVVHSHPFMNSTGFINYRSLNNLDHLETPPYAQQMFTPSQVPIEMPFPTHSPALNASHGNQLGPCSRTSPGIYTGLPFERQNNNLNGLFSSIPHIDTRSPVENLDSSTYTSPFTKDDHERSVSVSVPELNIVLEDPHHPSHLHKRRMRSKSESEQAKQNNKLIKSLGGACIWCYRKKKRCGTVVACAACRKVGLQCIRKYTELSLTKDSPKYPNRSAERIRHLFSCLKNHASQHMFEQVAVSFRSQTINLWTANAAKLNFTNTNTFNEMHQQLHLRSIESIQCDELNRLENLFPGVSPVGTASSMYKLASVIVCLCKTRVHVSAADVDRARLIVLFMLIVHLQRLYKLSGELCSMVFGTMRRKESHIEHAGMKNERVSLETLGPVWVALALYHRVIDCFVSFEAGPLAALLMDAKTCSDNVSANVLCALKNASMNSKSDTDSMTKKLLEQHIPIIHTRHFDTAIEVSRGSQINLLTATPAYSFCGASYTVESLFEGVFDSSTAFYNSHPETETDNAPRSAGQDWLQNLEAELAEIMPFDDDIFNADSDYWQMTLAEG